MFQGDKDEIEFAHLFFLRGQDHLLDQIKRKVSAAPKSGSGIGINQQFVPRIKSEKVVITQLPNPEVVQREEMVVKIFGRFIWTHLNGNLSPARILYCPSF